MRRIAQRITALEQQISRLKRGLPDAQVWAEFFAGVEGAELNDDHIKAAQTYMNWCAEKGYPPAYIHLHEYITEMSESVHSAPGCDSTSEPRE